jgi:RNA polymerase sigma factor (sigma-70 family)
MEKIKVLVADDHPVFQEGLCRFLEKEEDIEIVAKPNDGREAIDLAKELLPDVAIIDVIMPNINGIEAAKQISLACPNTAILMVSAYDCETYVDASLQAGASGYLSKRIPIRELINAIRLVHIGEAVFSLKTIVRTSHLNSNATVIKKATKHLCPREKEVLKLAAKGLSNKEIAKELGISYYTIQTHMVNIFKKLGVKSRTEAIFYAIKNGWFLPNEFPGKELHS